MKVLGLVLLIFPALLPVAEESLSLEQAVKLALSRNERALAAGEQMRAAEGRLTKARAVIGGLTLSTVLSLIVVPAFYVATDGLRVKLRDKFHFKKKQITS